MFWNLFRHKDNSEKKVDKTKPKLLQKVTRVWSYDQLDHTQVGFTLWNSEITKDPVGIGKIFEHLRTAYSIRLYITKTSIEYTAETKNRGQVSGSCRRGGYYFFEFGIRRSGHRFDFYGEDRTNPIIKEFYEWWGNLVSPYEKEFDNDYNL